MQLARETSLERPRCFEALGEIIALLNTMRDSREICIGSFKFEIICEDENIICQDDERFVLFTQLWMNHSTHLNYYYLSLFNYIIFYSTYPTYDNLLEMGKIGKNKVTLMIYYSKHRMCTAKWQKLSKERIDYYQLCILLNKWNKIK